jgi:hypothetical protein
MADVNTEYIPADGEKKAYAEIRVDGLTEEQSLALQIVLHEGALRERERIVNVIKNHASENLYDASRTIKLIEESANES